MNQKEFTYSLTNKAGLFYYVDNNIVKTTPTPTPLQYSPDGWKDQLVNYARNETYYGIFRSYTIPLQFVFDGAQILRSRLYVYGMEDVVNLVINRLNYDTGQYDLFYTGEIDFSKFEDSIDVFKVNVIEGGLSKYVKAYENVNQEISLNKDFIKVKMDGIKLHNRLNYGIVGDSALDYPFVEHTIGCVFGSEDGTSFDIVHGNSPRQDLTGWDFNTDNRWILKNVGNNPISFNISGKIDFDLDSIFSGDISIGMGFIKKGNILAGLIFQDSHAQKISYSKPFNLSITLNKNEWLYIVCGITGGTLVSYKNTDIKIDFSTKFQTTTIKAKKALSVGNELIKKIADNTHSLESNILKNTTIAISCGDAIRGIENPIVKTNFKDFFTSFNRNLEIAGSINNKKFIIEAKKTAYNNTLLYDLGEIKDAKFDFYEQLLANSIKLGYANQDYDDLNGRDEFNNTSEFKAPITRVNKLYDLTAPYRADMFGVEFTRINLQGKTTTDNNSDNDVFMLDVEYDFTDADGIENYKLRRPAFTSITGLIDPPSAFNLDLSPKRIFNKHGAWIRGMMWPLTTEKITFQTTDKNPLLKTVQGGVTIQENADVVISDLEPNYWIPITAKFETIVPDNLVDIMQSNSTGLFQFTYNGDTYKGWVIACSQKPSTDVEQQWTLLLSADNNINKLIHG